MCLFCRGRKWDPEKLRHKTYQWQHWPSMTNSTAISPDNAPSENSEALVLEWEEERQQVERVVPKTREKPFSSCADSFEGRWQGLIYVQGHSGDTLWRKDSLLPVNTPSNWSFLLARPRGAEILTEPSPCSLNFLKLPSLIWREV